MPDQESLGSQEKRVDEEWKQRARAEKQAAAGRQGQAPPGPPPRPTFSMLVTGIASDALISLGVVENPLTGKKERNLGLARHFIDLLQLLEEKTGGNLDIGEKRMLESVLYDLRMKFVSAASEKGSEKAREDG